MNRPYDVVLYGASGFTGRQTATYFAEHVGLRLRWALAGRNLLKLEKVRAGLGPNFAELPLIVADAQDQLALNRLAADTRVVLTTAGPFAKYGECMVAACVEQGTDYVDITGETPWVRRLIEKYHTQAVAQGTKIVPFCGVDSVPSDLMAFLLVRELQKQGKQPAQLKGYFQGQGGVNGGTLASAFYAAEHGQMSYLADPLLLNPTGWLDPQRRRENPDFKGVAYDADVKGWVSPFVMAPVNTRVVRRSEALLGQAGEGYGEAFRYQEYLLIREPLPVLSGLITAGMTIMQQALQNPVLRPLLQQCLPAPGQGPSESTMNNGFLRCTFVAHATDGSQLRAVLYDQGDPGNRVTVKLLCESALCLAEQREQLPGGSLRAGILTPAVALGEALAERLRAAGMQLDVGKI